MSVRTHVVLITLCCVAVAALIVWNSIYIVQPGQIAIVQAGEDLHIEDRPGYHMAMRGTPVIFDKELTITAGSSVDKFHHGPDSVYGKLRKGETLDILKQIKVK